MLPAGLLAAAILSPPARVSAVAPIEVDDNPTCQDISAGVNGLTIDPPSDGTHNDTDGQLSVEITGLGSAKLSFDWTSTLGVDAVIVKGGDSANVYHYDPESKGDSGLTAPLGPQGQQTQISHITFCYDAAPNVCLIDATVPGRILVDFPPTWRLRSDQEQGLERGPQPDPIVIPVGTYDITLASHDNHTEKAFQFQPEEQWYLEGRTSEDPSDTVFSTSAIDDLPFDQDYLEQQVGFGVVLSEAVTHLFALHIHQSVISNPNSINPVCVAFDPVPLGSIRGHKYEDVNGDGDLTDGLLLSGWTINLYRDDGDDEFDGDDQLVGSTATGTGDDLGKYWFMDLEPGDYFVEEECPAGWIQTWPTPDSVTEADCGTGVIGPISVGAGTVSENNDFGNFELATKSGHKYEDVDGDGDLTDDVNPLSGWTINLYLDDGTVAGEVDVGDTFVASDTTDASGFYQFTGLGLGDYVLEEDCTGQTGWIQTVPTPDSSDEADCGTGVITFTVDTSGATHEDNDFGNFQLGTKAGTKYEDPNGDGDLSDGVPIDGWDIYLYADIGSTVGVLDGTDVLLATVSSDANGDYSFGDLEAGDYLVCEELPFAWVQTYPAGDGVCGGTGIAPDGYAFEVTSGFDESGNDFGNFKLGIKSGTKYNDTNGDGDLSDGVPIGGWEIFLYDDTTGSTAGVLDGGDTLLDTQSTDANGEYSFADLEAGDYIVCEELPSGWIQTYPGGDDECGGTGIGPDGYDFTVTSGFEESGNDFGNFELIEKSGTKYLDSNGDGDLTGESVYTAGWTVNLYKDDGNGTLEPGDLVSSTVTAGDGTYSFGDLGPGTYWVCEASLAGWMQTFPDAVGAEVVDACDDVGDARFGYRFTATSGEDETGNDFGNAVVGMEGCTPGFWKNHEIVWGPTGYSPDQTLTSAGFILGALGTDLNGDQVEDSLLDALNYKGGKAEVGAARILLRAAVAALLNSAHPDIAYPRTVPDIIADVNIALASDRATMLSLAEELDADNNLGCPIDAHGNPIDGNGGQGSQGNSRGQGQGNQGSQGNHGEGNQGQGNPPENPGGGPPGGSPPGRSSSNHGPP